MAIDIKSIQVCFWKVLKFSMKTCFNFVKKYPAVSSVSVSCFLLYMLLPSVFTFLIYSLCVIVLSIVVYRVFFTIKYKGTQNVKGNKKLNESPSIIGYYRKNGSVSAHGQTARRRNAQEKVDYTRTGIEDKSMVCSTGFNDDLVDKIPVIEENLKEIREVKVDSVIDSGECSLSKKSIERGSSEDSEDEDAREGRNTVVEWTADDQKNLLDLGNSEIERNKRLESLIARRKARKLLSLQVRSTENNDSRDHISSILVPRNNPFLANDSHNHNSPMPGSAPSVLLPMHNPFDLPYDPYEEKPNLTGDSFHQEFLADHQKDMTYCRHESFSLGAFFPPESRQDRYETFFHDFPYKPRAPKRLENSNIAGQLDKKDNVDKIIEKESSQESEAVVDRSSAHATQEGQASDHVIDLVDIPHEEDRSEVQTKQMVDENIREESSSSSSFEECLPPYRPNKDAILRSLSRKNTFVRKDDNSRANGVPYDIDRFMFEKTRFEDPFCKEMHHTPNNSIASDMQVEVSDFGSIRSISSPDEGSLVQGEDMKKEITSGSEEMWPISSHISGYGAKSREVDEVSEHDITEVVEQDSINSHSLSPSNTGLRERVQAHTMNFNPEHHGVSDSLDAFSSQNLEKADHSTKKVVAHTCPIDSEKPEESSYSPKNAKRDEETIYDLSDSENNDTKKLNTASNLNSEAHISVKDLSGSSSRNNSTSFKNERPDSFEVYEGESEKLPEENDMAEKAMPVQSIDSLKSMNGEDEKGVSKVQLPGASNDPIAPDLVPEIVIKQVPTTSSLYSSPMSILQPDVSNDQVSFSDLSRAIYTDPQQSNNETVENDLAHELPPEISNHSAPQNGSLTTEYSTAQLSYDIEQSPRFIDTLSCVPFSPTNEELANLDLRVPSSSSRFLQEVQEPFIRDINAVNEPVIENIESDNKILSSLEAPAIPAEETDKKSVNDTDGMLDKLTEAPSVASKKNENSSVPFANDDDPSVYQQKPNQEANVSYHADKSVAIENEANINSESIKDIECETQLSINHVDLLEPSNSFSPKSIEVAEENPRKINSDDGAVGQSKATGENEKSDPEVKVQEFREAKVNEVADLQKAVEVVYSSVAIKPVKGECKTLTSHEAIFDPNQPEFKDDMDIPVRYTEIKDPSLHEQKPSQEVNDSYRGNKSMAIENEAKINSESVKDTEGQTDLSIKHVDLLEPSNSSRSKSIEDAEENSRKVDGDDGAIGPSEATGENKKSDPEVKVQELRESKINEVVDLRKAVEVEANSEAIKTVGGESKATGENEKSDPEVKVQEFREAKLNEVVDLPKAVQVEDISEAIEAVGGESKATGENEKSDPEINVQGFREAKLNEVVDLPKAVEIEANSEAIKAVGGESKATGENEKLDPEVKVQEFREAKLNEVVDLPKAVQVENKSEDKKVVGGESKTLTSYEAVFGPRQTEFKDDMNIPVHYMEIKEPLERPLGRSISDGSLILNFIEPIISASDFK